MSMEKIREYEADIYVTKWWATKGIILVHGARVAEYAGGSLNRMATWGAWGVTVRDQDFHFSYEDACRRVADQAERKIASVERQLSKLANIEAQARSGEVLVREVDGGVRTASLARLSPR